MPTDGCLHNPDWKQAQVRREEYRAIALNLIRVYRVDDQAWAPDEEAEKMLEKEINR